jgi:hypothetical protein
MTIPVTQYASAQVTFSVINIIPTTSAYEGSVARVYCDGSQCCSNVWGCPNLWAVVQIGNATMDPNVWGWEHLYKNSTYASRIGTGSTTMSISSGRVVVNSQWTIKEHPKYNTMAYHEVIYGAKPWGNQIINHQFLQLPKRISELPRILVGVYYDLTTGVPGNNFAFEAWIFPDGNNGRAAGPQDYEIMVQLYIEGGFPAGTRVAEYVVPILVDGQLVYQTFVMYDCRTDVGWRFFTFRSTTNYVGKHVVFDYYEFIKIANSYVGGALTNMYLMALEFGTEVYTNRCSSFPCTVNVQWTLNRYYFATTSSSISLVDALSEWAKVLTGTTPTATITPQPITTTITTTYTATTTVTATLTRTITSPVTTTVTTTVPITVTVPLRVPQVIVYQTLQRLYLIAKASKGDLWHNVNNNAAWSSWQPLGGVFADGPAAAYVDGKVYVTGRDGNGGIWYGFIDTTTNSFSGWTATGGASPSRPEAVATPKGVYIIVRGAASDVWAYSIKTGSWTKLEGGATSDTPGAAVMGTKVYVVIRGLDGASLWYGVLDVDSGTFSGWSSLNGAADSTPTVVADPSSMRVYIIVRAADNSIWYGFIDTTTNSFSGWTATGGASPSRPEAVATPKGVYIIVRGAASDVWAYSIKTGSWTKLEGGATSDTPGAAVMGTKVYVVIRGLDGASLWYGVLDVDSGTFSGWSSLNGAADSTPQLVNT